MGLAAFVRVVDLYAQRAIDNFHDAVYRELQVGCQLSASPLQQTELPDCSYCTSKGVGLRFPRFGFAADLGQIKSQAHNRAVWTALKDTLKDPARYVDTLAQPLESRFQPLLTERFGAAIYQSPNSLN
jgi:hypothetical protein